MKDAEQQVIARGLNIYYEGRFAGETDDLLEARKLWAEDLRTALLTNTASKILVDAAALRQLLVAINGPAHYIRELQVIRSLGDSPIDLLVDEYNVWAAKGTK
jgi:hypothetical protein